MTKLLHLGTIAAVLSFSNLALAVPPCPPALGMVERSVGPALIYLGADPANPELCRIKRGGQESLFYFGSWAKEWPGSEDAWRALQKVYAGPPGTEVKFDVVAAPGLQWHETLRNDGPEDLRILGQVRPTVRITHERQGFGGNTYHSIITQWKDAATNMTIYQNYRHISGHPEPGTSWDPVSITGGR